MGLCGAFSRLVCSGAGIAGVDWRLVADGRPVHRFARPDAGSGVSTSAAYNE